jgi:hypothetical protein
MFFFATVFQEKSMSRPFIGGILFWDHPQKAASINIEKAVIAP